MRTEAAPAQAAGKPSDREALLRRLRAQVGCINATPPGSAPTISTGCETIDQWLPGSGLPIAGVTEWIADHDSSGAASLSLIAAANHSRHLSEKRGNALPWVIVDPDGTFYPPAAIALGLPVRQMILVRPRDRSDLIWAIDQGLRCDAVAGVWASIPSRLNDKDSRRFQLASESCRKPAFFVRGSNVRGKPGFSEIQLHVSTSGAMTVTLDRCRGGVTGQSVKVGIDDSARLYTVSSDAATRHETAVVHLASQLAHPTPLQSKTGLRPNTGRTAQSRSSGRNSPPRKRRA